MTSHICQLNHYFQVFRPKKKSSVYLKKFFPGIIVIYYPIAQHCSINIEPLSIGSAPASAGARFMTELLVWSLLGGGGLRDALRNALQAHSADAYNHLQLDAYVFLALVYDFACVEVEIILRKRNYFGIIMILISKTLLFLGNTIKLI